MGKKGTTGRIYFGHAHYPIWRENWNQKTAGLSYTDTDYSTVQLCLCLLCTLASPQTYLIWKLMWQNCLKIGIGASFRLWRQNAGNNVLHGRKLVWKTLWSSSTSVLTCKDQNVDKMYGGGGFSWQVIWELEMQALCHFLGMQLLFQVLMLLLL